MMMFQFGKRLVPRAMGQFFDWYGVPEQTRPFAQRNFKIWGRARISAAKSLSRVYIGTRVVWLKKSAEAAARVMDHCQLRGNETVSIVCLGGLGLISASLLRCKGHYKLIGVDAREANCHCFRQLGLRLIFCARTM